MMMLTKTSNDLPFVIHEHSVDDTIYYELSIQTAEDELEFLQFPRTGNMATISDNPNITRLFGEKSENVRSASWLDFSGETKTDIYKIYEKGLVRIGEQTGKFSELFFKSDKLSGRWILRKIPNVFDKSFLTDPEVYLWWKPPRQKSFDEAFTNTAMFTEVSCPCGVKEMSAKFHEIASEEGTEMVSRMTSEVSFNSHNQTFSGIAMAEGTWIDMFGIKYVYTPEFVIHTFNKQRAQGDIELNTEHDMFGESIDGRTTGVRLRQEPINHIEVNGVYNGPTALSEGEVGLSYEFRLRSSWNEDFQAWVPFDSITEKLSVVKRPACKICWINKVN